MHRIGLRSLHSLRAPLCAACFECNAKETPQSASLTPHHTLLKHHSANFPNHIHPPSPKQLDTPSGGPATWQSVRLAHLLFTLSSGAPLNAPPRLY